MPFTLNSEGQELLWLALSTIVIIFPNVVGIILVVLLTLMMIWQHRKNWKQIIQSSGWFGIFILYSALTSLTSRNFIGFLISLVYIIYVAFFAYYRSIIQAKTYLRLLKIIVLASVLVNFVAYWQYVSYVYQNGYDIFYVFKYHNIQVRPAGTLFNANVFGVFCIFAILIALFLLLKANRRGRGRRLYYLFIIVINVVGMSLTGSRMIWPALLASLFVMLFINHRKAGLSILVIGLCLLGILIAFPDLYPRFASLAYAFQDRFKIWHAGLELFKLDPIFGSGPLTYRNSYYLISDLYKLHTHSIFIELLTSYGLVGCVILGLACKDYFKELWRNVTRPELRSATALILAVFVTVIAHGIVDFAVFSFQLAYIFLLIILPPTPVLEDLVHLDEQTHFIVPQDSSHTDEP